MLDPSERAIMYRMAKRVEANANVVEIAREADVPIEFVKMAFQQAEEDAKDPTMPTPTEWVILYYIRESQNDMPGPERIAQECDISTEEAQIKIDEMVSKNLIYDVTTRSPTGQPRTGTVTSQYDPSTYPQGMPKTATRLVAQATKGGYAIGEDEQSDTDITLAALIINKETTLIKLNPQNIAEITELIPNDDNIPSPGWPSTRAIYIEPEEAWIEEDNDKSRTVAGILIARPETNSNERTVIVFLDQQSHMSNHTFIFDPDRGTARSYEGIPQPHDPENKTGHLMLAILKYLSGDDKRLRAAPMNQTQRQRVERGDLQPQWLLVTPDKKPD